MIRRNNSFAVSGQAARAQRSSSHGVLRYIAVRAVVTTTEALEVVEQPLGGVDLISRLEYSVMINTAANATIGLK